MCPTIPGLGLWYTKTSHYLIKNFSIKALTIFLYSEQVIKLRPSGPRLACSTDMSEDPSKCKLITWFLSQMILNDNNYLLRYELDI